MPKRTAHGPPVAPPRARTPARIRRTRRTPMSLSRLTTLGPLAITLWVAGCISGENPGSANQEIIINGSASTGTSGGGCTLTQGYWKNHPDAWPVNSLVIGGETYTEDELIAILQTPVQGDASLILGHQLIAALLNTDNGVSADPDTASALADAEAWMLANKDADGRLPYGTTGGAAAGEATALGEALDNFNQGVAGPGHCN